MLNPMAGLITMYRVALLGDIHIANQLSNVNLLDVFLYSAAASLFTLFLGYGIFKKHEPVFADLVK